MAALMERPAKKMKTENTKKEIGFIHKVDYDRVKFGMEVTTNYNKKMVVAIKDDRTMGKLYDVEFRSPPMGVRFSDLNIEGSQYNGDFTVSLCNQLHEKYLAVDPSATKRATDFMHWVRGVCQDMLELAWEDDRVWKTHKDKIMKKLKKSKCADIKKKAKEMFMDGATMSLFKTYDAEELDMVVFRKKNQSKDGKSFRPKMWRRESRDTDNMIEFSKDVDYVSKQSVVKVDFRLKMYDTSTMYGIKGELGWNLVALYLDAYKKKAQIQKGNHTYVEF